MTSAPPKTIYSFPDPSPELSFLQEIDSQLSAAELVGVTRRIYESGAWRDYIVVSPDLRDYRLIYENDFTDVWALSWLPGQTTGFHDHYLSEVGITVAQGCVREAHLHLDASPTDHVLSAGQSQEGPFGYIHQVAYESGDPAVSLHAYSPPLAFVGQYRERGSRMVRFQEPGRRRLSP